MGTNFYLYTKDKQVVQELAPYSYELTDIPDFGYKIHIAKTSMGWLPLFQAHMHGIQSVAEYLDAITKYNCRVYDEYGTEYFYDDFVNRVLNFNGGVVGGIEPTYIGNLYHGGRIEDYHMPDYKPISHMPGTKQSYNYGYQAWACDYFTDPQGYEFDRREFS